MPPGLFSDANTYLDFLNGIFIGNTLADVTVARTTTGTGAVSYSWDSLGTYTPFADNTRRYTNLGLLVEEARTNVVLRNRDLTNVAWTATTMTAVKDQTGIDGVANSASSILATGASATILQSITLASSARWQTAFVKRITGVGTINMTMDNGGTWTAITVTSSWTRVSIPSQTITNPVVGFQIITSGDKIAVDFVQNENSGFYQTSPILTLDAAGVRSKDTVSLANTPAFGVAFSFFVQCTSNTLTGAATTCVVGSINDGTISNDLFNLMDRISGRITDDLQVGAVNKYASTVMTTNWFGLSVKSSGACTSGTQQHCAGGTLGTAHAITPIFVPTTITIGARGGSSQQINGFVEKMAVWSTRAISDATQQSITT